MKRTLWTATIGEHSSPPWPCPACGKGVLSLVPKSLLFHETVLSKRAHHPDEPWYPEDTNYVFAAWLKCSQPHCGQDVAASGTGGIEQWQTPDEEGEPDIVYSKYFVPKSLSPTPDIFNLPGKCPDKVKAHLRAGFKLFFLDQSAAANRIRVALEILLDHLRVPRRRKDQNGRLSDLSLHRRIEIYTGKSPALGNQIMALKWLGNTASHEGQVSRDDLLDAFEILEHILIELIEKPSVRVSELARNLMKKHRKKK